MALGAVSPLAAVEVEPPVPVRTIAPDFPQEMRESKTSGIVVVNCEVNEKGVVTDAKISKTTNEAFDKAALMAVSKWKFRPAQQDGKAVAVRINLPVKFNYEE